MSSASHVHHASFGGLSFAIACNTKEALALASFLFADLPCPEEREPAKRFDMLFAGHKPMLSLWDGDYRLYFGQSLYQMAYVLMNEVLFHCMDNNSSQHAIHAGAVIHGDCCILLPGTSGCGKSTLTAWLISHGYQYLTDELIFLADTGQVSPFVRPISLKTDARRLPWLRTEQRQGEILVGEEGSMIPHRLLNPDFAIKRPLVTHIVFPEYRERAVLELHEITPAQSSLYLMQSHVNARYHPRMGLPELAGVARQCRSFKLTYGAWQDLHSAFSSSSALFSPEWDLQPIVSTVAAADKPKNGR